MSESIIGLPAHETPFIYLHQPAGERSFKGMRRSQRKEKNGKFIAAVTANDYKSRWDGGYLATYDSWTEERKDRYGVLRDFYSHEAADFYKKYGDPLDIEWEVKEFLGKLSGRILVVGCGSGKEVRYLSKGNNDVWGFDLSSEAILMAKSEHPHLKERFFVEDLYNLDRIMDGKFDGIVANAILLHLLDRDDISNVLKSMHNRLNKGGVCFIRLIEKYESNGEFLPQEFDSKYLDTHIDEKSQRGKGRWFVYYKQTELIRFAKDAGFHVIKKHRKRHDRFPNIWWLSILLKSSESLKSYFYF